MRMKQSLIIAAGIFGALATGCSLSDLKTPDRMDKGLVIILPGMEGRSAWNYELARGLDEGGVKCGIEIYAWGTPIPGGMLLNVVDRERNERVAKDIRDHIVAYRHEHPRRPVHLIGHSAGGGEAIFATELLPPDEPVSSVILLAAALSPTYDLSPALRRSQYGVFNYYSELDVGFLGAGTAIAGTVDREHALAAGAVGFREPSNLDGDGRQLYADKLHQVKWDPEMRWSGNFGGHLDWTNRPFARKYLASMLNGVSGWRYDEPESVQISRRPNSQPVAQTAIRH